MWNVTVLQNRLMGSRATQRLELESGNVDLFQVPLLGLQKVI